ncbi:MAG: squalene/phytoene synthase family protein [Actinomycetota bacterium]|nr:squalene/phytoene synthase family protein [Actinomycetota bacterium]
MKEPLVVVEVSHNGVPAMPPASDVAAPSPGTGRSALGGVRAPMGVRGAGGVPPCQAQQDPAGVPVPGAVLARADHENFPVALRILAAAERRQLMAVYGFARLVDDIGDELQPVEARPGALAWVEQELERAQRHEASHPLFVALGELLDTGDAVVLQALRDLIAANRLDQVTSRYERYDDLLASCALSANPVGRLVLAIFGAGSEERLALSDDVCTGLQLTEHLQDLREDARRGRIYLAAEDRRRWGCDEEDLLASTASVAVRRLVADYARRARELLGAAVPLADGLAPRHQVALAGFAAGGLAALDAIAEADFDVLGVACRPSRARLVIHGGRLLVATLRQRRARVAEGHRGTAEGHRGTAEGLRGTAVRARRTVHGPAGAGRGGRVGLR